MARKIIPLRRKKQEPKLSRAEQSQRANRTILRRTLVLMALFGVVVFIPLIVTLYNLMIRDHDYYEAQAIDNQTRYTSLSASRGQIFDRNMNVFASSKTVETVFIDPNEIAQEMAKPENSNLLDHIARGLSEILDVSTDFVYKQASDKAFRYKVIRRKIPEELADELEIPVDKISDTLKVSGRHISVDAPFVEGEDNSLLDVLVNDDSPMADRTLVNESLSREIDRALSTLSEREKEIIQMFFGINHQEMTLEEIGDKFNLTRERVRQIKEKAIRRLRQNTKSKLLKSYLG